MDLERLNEFVTIAQQGNLKKAAQILGISVATLSARLIRFEEHLGTQLFIRSGTTMELSDSGKSLLPNALEILSRYQSIQQDMHRAQEHAYHQLRIAITGSSLPLHLGPFLDKLILDHPNMQLELLDDSQHSIAEGLTSGAVDLYFSPVTEDQIPKNLIRHYVGSPGEFVLLPRSHPLADRSMVSIRELDGECFILYPKTAETVIRDFQLKNLRDSGIRYSIYDSNTAVVFSKLLVPIGKGVFLYTHTIDLPPNTVCIPVTDLPHHASICFFHHKNSTNPDVAAFVTDYLAFAKEMARYEHK